MTRADSQAFFRSYERAFADLDADRVAAMYETPSVIVDVMGTVVFDTEAATVRNMDSLCAYYRDEGLVGVTAKRIDVEQLGRTMAEVDVGWALELTDRTVEFATRYWLVDRGRGIRIAGVLAYNESAAFADDA